MRVKNAAWELRSSQQALDVARATSNRLGRKQPTQSAAATKRQPVVISQPAATSVPTVTENYGETRASNFEDVAASIDGTSGPSSHYHKAHRRLNQQTAASF